MREKEQAISNHTSEGHRGSIAQCWVWTRCHFLQKDKADAQETKHLGETAQMQPVFRTKQFLRSQLHRLGLDIIRYRPSPKWREAGDRFEYQKQFIQFDIQPGSVVLDIGSGSLPFRYATILSDRHMKASPDRTGKLVRDDRPFFVSDIEHLPLRDKSIDFAYCSHVLEHVDDPNAACSELVRVARGGYIETPNLAKDLLFAWSDRIRHKWHVVAINNTLYFFEYTERQRKGIDSPVWDQLIHGPAYHPIQDAFFKNLDLFNVMFLWKDQFEWRVISLLSATCQWHAGERCKR
jgi:SAM-dependent methyltransferase